MNTRKNRLELFILCEKTFLFFLCCLNTSIILWLVYFYRKHSECIYGKIKMTNQHEMRHYERIFIKNEMSLLNSLLCFWDKREGNEQKKSPQNRTEKLILENTWCLHCCSVEAFFRITLNCGFERNLWMWAGLGFSLATFLCFNHENSEKDVIFSENLWRGHKDASHKALQCRSINP